MCEEKNSINIKTNRMRSRLMILMVLVAAVCVTGCKEEESRIPTVPKDFSLGEGAVLEDLTVKLWASGSTVEDGSYQDEKQFIITNIKIRSNELFD